MIFKFLVKTFSNSKLRMKHSKCSYLEQMDTDLARNFGQFMYETGHELIAPSCIGNPESSYEWMNFKFLVIKTFSNSKLRMKHSKCSYLEQMDTDLPRNFGQFLSARQRMESERNRIPIRFRCTDYHLRLSVSICG